MKSRAFTLIELLVVIAIIGVLSSVVLASLNTARLNGRIAAGKEFDSSNYHALGDYLAGEWNFEETNGTAALDVSGNNNAGTLLNSPTRVTGLRGQALQFNGSNQYIQMANSVVPSGGSSYTVSVWFIADDQVAGSRELVSQWTGAYSGNSFFLGTIQNTHIRFSDNWPNVDIGSWSTAEWHQITVVSTPTDALIYFDGAIKARKGSPLTYIGIAPFVIGRQADYAQEYWKGKIDEVRVYTRALSSEEIGQQYAAGVPAHTVAER